MSRHVTYVFAIIAALTISPAIAQQTGRSAQPAPAPAPARGRAETVNPTGSAVAAFQKRVEAYLAVRDKADAAIPAVKHADNPKEIAERETALGTAMRTVRAGVKQGDIFAPDIAPLFRKVISDDYKKRTPQEKKNLQDEHQEFDGFLPKVNATYPTTVTLATFPAPLLAALPRLPDKLEYRLVRNTLVLRDSYANMIVDVLPNVY
jgi:hypothetical protein